MKRTSLLAVAWCCHAVVFAQPGAVPATDAPVAPSLSEPAVFDAAAAAGKRLYHQGRRQDDAALRGRLGPGVWIEADAAACSRCHGAQGQGRRDAGVATPALNWTALRNSRPGAGGLRARPAYDQTSLLRALREGIGADGAPLAHAMPRFDVGAEDVAGLVRYLQVIGTEADPQPGVSADRVVLGLVLPLSGPLQMHGQAAQAAAAACLERANRHGGLYGRRIETLAIDSATGADAAQRTAAETLFVVAPWWGEYDARALAQRLSGVPLIGPLGAAGDAEGAPATVFAVAPQWTEQARMLVDAAAEAADADSAREGRTRIALIVAPGSRHQHAGRSARRQAGLHSSRIEWLEGPAEAGDPSPSAIRAWAETTRPDAWLVLGGPAWVRAAAEAAVAVGTAGTAADRAGTDARAPAVYAVFGDAGQASRDWPAALSGRLRLALAPARGQALDPSRLLTDLRAIGASSHSPAVEASAYTSACLGVEALRRTGRQLTRERLLHELERIDAFDSGVSGALSFAPGQRMGLRGAELVRWGSNGQLETVLSWRTPRQP